MSDRLHRHLPWPECDVVVLGGGPAGTAAAVTLARAGRSVTVIEKSHYEQTRVGETLPPAAQPLLVSLAVWEPFLAAGHLASPGVLAVWGDAELYETHFILNAHGQGWHLDRQRFDRMLALAARRAGARVYCGAEITSCARTGDRWQVSFTCRARSGRRHRRLRATFLVDATGRAAALARWQGARRLNADRLVGFAGVLAARSHEHGAPADECDSCTLVEACADGWWYSALLPGNRVVAVYLTDADLLRRQHGAWHVLWRDRLRETTHTRARLSAFELWADPHVVAAASSRLDCVCGRDWLAVGDAAMTFDPLSSQGLMQALASGIRAGEALNAGLAGEAASMRAYATTADEVFGEYSRLHAVYYGREQRWPHSVFWRRRHSAAA